MADADEFLKAWTLERSDVRPLSREEARMVADQWAADAQDNDIAADALADAAGGDVADYLLRTFGEEGEEVSTDGGDHSQGVPGAPPALNDSPGFAP